MLGMQMFLKSVGLDPDKLSQIGEYVMRIADAFKRDQDKMAAALERVETMVREVHLTICRPAITLSVLERDVKEGYVDLDPSWTPRPDDGRELDPFWRKTEE